MGHRFDPRSKKKLVDEERQRVQPAEEIVQRANPSKDEICADVGCGIGYVAIPLSRVVRQVIAIDSQKEMLSTLISRANDDERGRISPVLSELPLLPMGSKVLDRIVIVNVLHEVEEKETLVSEVLRVLRPGGRLTVVDFQKVPTSFGPPVKERIERTEVPALFKGLSIVCSWSYPEFYQFELEAG